MIPHVAIVGRKNDVLNYENAFSHFHIPYTCTLDIGSLYNYDGLLLPGGGDIAPAFYGEMNSGSKNIDTELDILQIQAAQIFIQRKKPILGICKGLQLLNIVFGGTLSQNITTASLHQEKGIDLFHKTFCISGTIMHSLYGESVITNSCHHQAIHKLGKNLILTQQTTDLVAEGIAHTTLPVIAVQWHPERMLTDEYFHTAATLFEYYYSLLIKCQT